MLDHSEGIDFESQIQSTEAIEAEVEAGPIIIGKRLLRRAPSPEIAELRQRFPFLYESKTAPTSLLCANSGINYIGALLVNSVKSEIIRTFRSTPSEYPHEDIFKPIEVVNKVELFEKKVRKSDPLGITLDNVLVKYVAGKTTGLVLSGPYAGLVLEPLRYNSSDISPGMAVSKIWNDDPEEKRPYDIGIKTESGKEYPEGYAIYRQKREAFFSSPEYIYRPLYESFFTLLGEAGIPINPEEFHASTVAGFNRTKI